MQGSIMSERKSHIRGTNNRILCGHLTGFKTIVVKEGEEEEANCTHCLWRKYPGEGHYETFLKYRKLKEENRKLKEKLCGKTIN